MSFSKRVDQARRVFTQGDKAASDRAHDPDWIAQAAQEGRGGTGSQFFGDLVYGGLAAGVAYAVGALLRGLGV